MKDACTEKMTLRLNFYGGGTCKHIRPSEYYFFKPNLPPKLLAHFKTHVAGEQFSLRHMQIGSNRTLSQFKNPNVEGGL